MSKVSPLHEPFNPVVERLNETEKFKLIPAYDKVIS